MNTELTNAIVYSQENCFACNNAVSLLKSKGYTVEVRKLDASGPWTKKHLLELVPDARSVPQIFVGTYYVGGFNELVKYFKEGQ